MTYGGKSAATGYSAFNKSSTSPNTALENSNDAANTDNNNNDVVAQRKKAIKKRLMSMRGN